MLSREALNFVVIALIMLPAAILFLISVFGQETNVNRWLEAHFRLSYHIPISREGALLLFLTVPLLILLYFLKLKRKPIQVPSTFL